MAATTTTEEDGVLIEEVEQEGKEKAAEPSEDSATDTPQVADGNEMDAEMNKIEEEKKNMTAEQKLERSLLWKAEGNKSFKENEIFKAADSYYHAVLFCRDLTQNPKYYPNLKHTEEQRQMAKDLCESVFTNLALVQCKYGTSLAVDHPERHKVLTEALKSAGEALKLNASNVKALFRQATARSALANAAANGEAQTLLGEAKSDIMKIIELDAQNRDARTELKSIQERLKVLKKEEVASEKKNFSFAGTLGGLSSKEKDILGDGSVKKLLVSAGDGGVWMNNEEWLKWDGKTKCVVHIKASMLSNGGDDGQQTKNKSAAATSLSFILGDSDMYEGFGIAVRHMSLGEVSNFTFAATRMTAKSALTKLMPSPKGSTSVWELTFVKFVTWEDVDHNGEKLVKVINEGYGSLSPEPFSEVAIHWRVFGSDGNLLHSSRYTINVADEGGLKHVEDEDKDAPIYILGESCWEPLTLLCQHIRQGGVGELRMRNLPDLPKDESKSQDATSAQLSMMMNKKKTGEALFHSVVRAELERVVAPLAGPNDPRWEGVSVLVEERFRAEQLLEKGDEAGALARLRRAVSWAEQLAEDRLALQELDASRAAIGWILACRAAPILDLGNVTSDVMAVARRDIEEAKEHCAWLRSHGNEFEGTYLLEAKILVAEDDDFANANKKLMEAQRIAPNDKRVQEELRKVKIELARVEEEESRHKVLAIRDSLKKAREGPRPDETAMLSLLQELYATSVSWETVMDTRIGVELKRCQEAGSDKVKTLCGEILAKLKDEAKEQRPMWDKS